MTMRTKGDLCALTVREEQDYGKIDASGASVYGGTLRTMSTPEDRNVEEITGCTRTALGHFRTSAAYSMSAVFTFVRGQGWEDWVERAIGALTGVQRQTPSFDTAFRVAPGENHLLTGCRINTLTISASEIGAPLEFTAEAVARWHTMTPFKDSDGTSLSMDLASIPKGAPITYNSMWEWSDGGSYTKIPGKSWSLKISQSLASEPGASSDDGGTDVIKLEAGGDSVPQASEITLDITITSTGPEWDRRRLEFTDGLTFRTTIDGRTVTLKDCYLKPDMPDRSQGTYDETISVVATDMEVS